MGDFIGRVLPLPLVVLAFVFGYIVVVNLFRMVSGRHANISLYDSPLGRFSLLFSTAKLGANGLKARRRVIVGVVGLAGCFIGVTLIALLSRLFG